MAVKVCLLCERSGLYLPMNRRVAVCRWCGIEWVGDSQTAKQWRDGGGNIIPLPESAPLLLGGRPWNTIEAREGKYLDLGGRSIPWNGIGVLHWHDDETGTIFIHTPASMMEG